MNKEVEKVIKEKLTEQFQRGVREGAYGVAGAIHKIIQKNKNCPDLGKTINEIEAFLIPALGLKKGDKK